MRSARSLAIVALAAALAATGCSSAADDTAETLTVEVTRTVTVNGGGGDDGLPSRTDVVPADDSPDAVTPLAPGGARAAVRLLTRRLGYSPEFEAIGLYDAYAIFRVRDRDRPGNVDSYTVREGQVSAPDPVRIDRDAVADEVFRLAEVDLDAVPRLVARAQRLDLEDADVCCVLIERFGASRQIGFYVNVSGSRESAQLRADARGRVTGIVR